MGNSKIFVNQNFSNPEEIIIGNFHLSLFTSPKPNGEGNNGDAMGVIDLGTLGLVCLLADGAGGTPGGNQASGLLLQTIMDYINDSQGSGGVLRDMILTGIEKANEEILNKKTGAATTLCVAELVGNEFRTYHIGDSTIALFGNHGKIITKTVSHSPHGYALEAGLMEESDIPTDEQVMEVSNLVGSNDMRIEMGISQNFKIRDTLIICSDGVTDNLMMDELGSLIRKGPLKKAGHNLQHMLKEKMDSQAEGTKPDDISWIICRAAKRSSAPS